MLNNLDYARLKIFFSIYLEKGIHQAARKLHITPAAVSQNLRNLEEGLHLQLFVRGPRLMVPTDKGHELFTSLYPLFQEIESRAEEVVATAEEIRGTLRVGTPYNFGVAFLLPTCSKVRNEFPRLEFALEYGAPEKLLPALQRYELDLTFIDESPYLTQRLSAFTLEKVFSEELSLVCSQSFYQQHVRGKASPQLLITLPHITYTPGATETTYWYRHHFGPPARPLCRGITVDNVSSVIEIICRDQGLGVVPKHLVAAQLRSKKLIEIPTGKPSLVHAVFLLTFKDKRRSAAESLLIKEVKDEVTRLARVLRPSKASRKKAR